MIKDRSCLFYGFFESDVGDRCPICDYLLDVVD